MKAFVKEFFLNHKNTWSIIPSSSFLAKSMISSIDFSEDLLIVQLWPWTWIITKTILKKMSKNSKIISFENNKNFDVYLSEIKDNRFKVIYDSAENIKNYISKDKVDVIISGVPLWSISDVIKEKILVESKISLKIWWKFIQFQYFLQNKNDIKRIFWKYKLEYQLLNFPPAFIYKCKKT